MSCSACQKVVVIDPSKHGLQYSLVEGVTVVDGLLGRPYQIHAPLIPRMYSPRGGWAVTLYLHGQATVINERTAHEVFTAAAAFLTLNEIVFTALNLWFNLNIQWVARAIDRYQQVPLSSLLDIAITHYSHEV